MADEREKAKAKARARARAAQSRQVQQPLPTDESLPELSGVRVGDAGQSARLAAGFVTTPDEESRKDIMRKVIPGTDFRQDEDGNTVVILPGGEKAFLNKPGFSQQDMIDFAADVVKFIPAARFAAGGKGIITRMLRGGTAAAVTSGAEDLAATFQGSEQGFQGKKAATTIAADVAGEGAASVLGPVGRVLKRTFGKRTGEVFTASGELTGQAKNALQKAGIDPQKISPELAVSAIRLSERGVAPKAAQGVAQSGRFGVPLTRGQATGDFTQLAGEESLRGRTDAAGDIMRQFDQRQNQRLVEINREIQEEMGGAGTAISREAEAGARIGGEVRRQADELSLAIDDAFENARGANAALNREGLDRLAEIPTIIREQDDVLVDEALTPATNKALQGLEELSGDEVTEQTVKQLETFRRRLNQLQGASKNNTDRRGVTLIKRRFDQYLDDAVDNALFTGDDDALELIKNARSLRAEYGKRLQENAGRLKSGRKKPDPGGRAVESIVENNATDEGVVNMIFGRSRLFNSENAVKSIRALRNATNNSEEVNNTLKQLTFRRISSQAIDNGKFSPRKFISAFDKMEKENPAVIKEIFTPDEWKSIKDFRNLSERLIQPEHTINPSRTAETIQRMLGSMGMVTGLQSGGIGFGALGGRIGRGVGGAIERGSSRSFAQEAVNPQLLLPGRPNATTVSAAIAAARQGGPEAIDRGLSSGEQVEEPATEQ